MAEFVTTSNQHNATAPGDKRRPPGEHGRQRSGALRTDPPHVLASASLGQNEATRAERAPRIFLVAAPKHQ